MRACSSVGAGGGLRSRRRLYVAAASPTLSARATWPEFGALSGRRRVRTGAAGDDHSSGGAVRGEWRWKLVSSGANFASVLLPCRRLLVLSVLLLYLFLLVTPD